MMLAVFHILMAATVAAEPLATRFSQWKADHGKTYSNAADEARAFEIFAQNDVKIKQHNTEEGRSYVLGHNFFSDLTAKQFAAAYLGRFLSTKPSAVVPTALHITSSQQQQQPEEEEASTRIPDSVDWSALGKVTPVVNEGTCGATWAIAAVGAIESAHAIATNTTASALSVGQVTDCTPHSECCNGGEMDDAYAYAMKHGLCTAAQYPYTENNGTRCHCNHTKEEEGIVKIKTFVDVKGHDEDAMRAVVAKQPLTVSVEADTSVFQLYKSGIIDSPKCEDHLDHALLAVGYGTEGGKDYWKLRNQWGAAWGEAGYVRLVRGENMCGVSETPSYPVAQV